MGYTSTITRSQIGNDQPELDRARTLLVQVRDPFRFSYLGCSIACEPIKGAKGRIRARLVALPSAKALRPRYPLASTRAGGSGLRRQIYSARGCLLSA